MSSELGQDRPALERSHPRRAKEFSQIQLYFSTRIACRHIGDGTRREHELSFARLASVGSRARVACR